VDGSEQFLDPDGRRISLRDALAENADAVFRFLWKMSGDEELARDLAQDAMVKAILRFDTFRGASSFRTWLLAIAANLYRDDLRKKRPLRLEDEEQINDEGRGADEVVRRLDAERAAGLVARLAARKRAALVLRFESGLSYEEIASIARCPVGTVRSRIHEAIEELRRKMGESHG
jgi:RNA polymerase sigma-70 factor (ECF subfamily)